MEASVIGGRQKLRSLELKAYRSVVDALRAQGALTKDKQEILRSLAASLNVSEQRYRSEIRRAVNDEMLTSIARTVTGHETEYAWRTESMRKVPLVPMVAPETIFTPFADTISDIVSRYNQQLTDSLTPSPSMEKMQNTNIQANIKRIAEERILYPVINEMKFDEEALLDELNKIKSCNTFSCPEDYLSMMNNSRKFDNSAPELSLPRKATAISLPSPKAFFASNEEIVTEVSETMPEKVLNKTITKVTNTTSPFHVPKSIPNLPIKSKKKVLNSRPRLEMSNDQEQTTRMVRKAKLNAKRWNPKTKTLESPTKKEVDINIVKNDTVERNIVKMKRSPIQRRDEKVSTRQLAINADGIPVEKTVCSTQRGRQTARWMWGRQNRIEKKVQRTKKSGSSEAQTIIQVDDSLKKLPEKFNSNVDKVNEHALAIHPKKKMKKTPTANTKTSLNNSKDAMTKSLSRTFNIPSKSTRKSNLLSEEEWLQGLSLVPTSRPINILRKRVCLGGTQIQDSSKKICSSSLSVEATKKELVNNFQPEVFLENSNTGSVTKSKYLAPSSSVTALKKETTSKDVADDFCKTVPNEETRSSPTKLNESTLDSLKSKEEITLDSTPESKELIENHVTVSLQTEMKQPMEGSKQSIEKSATDFSKTEMKSDSFETGKLIEISSEDFLNKKINCNSIKKFQKEASCSEATILESEIAKSSEPVCNLKKTNCEFAIESEAFVSNSSMDTWREETKSVKSLTEERQSDSPHTVKRPNYEDYRENRGGVKMLRPGCKKDISDLLGSNVRVRTVRVRGKGIRKILPRTATNASSNTSLNLNNHLVGKKVEKPVYPIEHLAEVTNINPLNILMTEEVLSGSDDETNSYSPAISVLEIPADNDCMISSKYREQKEDLPVKIVSDNPSNLIELSDLKNDCNASQSATIEKSVQEAMIDTISEMNEDWRETDGIIIDPSI